MLLTGAQEEHRQNLMDWLKNGESAYQMKFGYYVYRFHKLNRDERFAFIFRQSSSDKGPLKMEDLLYTGIYDKETECLHDAGQALCEAAKLCGHEEASSYKSASKHFEAGVRAKINAIINSDRRNLSITDESQIDDYSAKSTIHYAREHKKLTEARNCFMEGKKPENIVYDSHFSFSRHSESLTFTKDDYLASIVDYEGTVSRYAFQWIDGNQGRIYAAFIENDELQKSLQAIYDNPQNPLHYMRAISQAVSDTACKTVHVTTVIDGKELTFKIEAERLKGDCGLHYSTFHLPAQDRRMFEEAYGRHADYGPLDITQITYSRNVLYDRETFEQSLGNAVEDQESAQGLPGLCSCSLREELTLAEFVNRHRHETGPVFKAAPPEEAALFFSKDAQDEQTGRIVHMRGDFDSTDKLYNAWFHHCRELGTPEFAAEVDLLYEKLCERGNILHSFAALADYCRDHPESRLSNGIHKDNTYGYKLETEKHSYYLRLTPIKGDYQIYLYCYNREKLDAYLSKAQQAQDRPEQSGNDSTGIVMGGM